jgi:hypothetical protein
MPITEAKQIGTSIHVFEGQREIARYEGKLLSFNILEVRVQRDNRIYTFGVNGHQIGQWVPVKGESP